MRDTCPPQSKGISMLSSFPSGLKLSLVTICINSGVRPQKVSKMVTELILSNQENLNVYFSFVGSGMAKIIKLNEKELIEPKNIKSREISIKNSLRKILKK